ncbi:MAG: Maf family protein, partial [Bacteroidales bacterium]|nr:Maf family protein [Bacteroidales bacterium]
LGKPHSREEAVLMLRKLSGREHEVVTAVTIRDNSRKLTFSDSSSVRFAALDDKEIDYYIDNYKPFDKAGAYGIQEWIGYAAIESIKGSFYNIMGLPVHRIYQEIKSFL